MATLGRVHLKGLYCPMGCGETLYTVMRTNKFGGDVVECHAGSCLRPTAAAEILADPETEHVVKYQEDGISIKHPLHERLDDRLMDCGTMDWAQKRFERDDSIGWGDAFRVSLYTDPDTEPTFELMEP